MERSRALLLQLLPASPTPEVRAFATSIPAVTSCRAPIDDWLPRQLGGLVFVEGESCVCIPALVRTHTTFACSERLLVHGQPCGTQLRLPSLSTSDFTAAYPCALNAPQPILSKIGCSTSNKRWTASKRSWGTHATTRPRQ